MKRQKKQLLKQSKQSVLIVGSGDVARRIIPWLAQRFRVRAVVRNPDERAALRALGACPVVADLDRPESLRRLAGLADGIIHCAPPPNTGEGDPRTRRLLAALALRGSLPRRIVYISTTGIYGDCGGAWLDETAPPRPATARARRRVAAEAMLRAFGQRTGCQVSLLRAPGIYDGAERLPLARLERGDPVLLAEDDVYTNHIHADDLAWLLALAWFRGAPGRAYNATDDSALKMGDYFDLVADHFGLPRPPRLARAALATRLNPITLSFMAESRRLHNRRICHELGARLRYPTVGATLAALA